MSKENFHLKKSIFYKLEKIKEGVNPLELVEKLEKDEEQGKKSDIRGKESEQNVQRALRELEIVEGVTLTKRYSKDDRNQIDAFVVIRENIVGDEQIYKLQIKSSDNAIEQAKRKILQRYHILPDQLDGKLRSLRLLFINGQLSDEEIRQMFISKYHEMRSQQYAEAKERSDYYQALRQTINFSYETNLGGTENVLCIAIKKLSDGTEIVVQVAGRGRKDAKNRAVHKMELLVKEWQSKQEANDSI